MSYKVLVVEDEATHAMVLTQTLESLGHEVVGVARDGEEGYLLRKKLDPDIVLMDLLLPKMDGIHSATLMNKEKPLPIILITGLPDPRLLAGAREAGIMSYLIKPIESDVLGPALELAFSNFNLIRDFEEDIVDLREALLERKFLERAKGILTRQHGLDDEQAMNRLKQSASKSGLTLLQTAKYLIAKTGQ